MAELYDLDDGKRLVLQTYVFPAESLQNAVGLRVRITLRDIRKRQVNSTAEWRPEGRLRSQERLGQFFRN